MRAIDSDKLMLISAEEFGLRLDKIRSQMAEQEIPALLISDNANKYYITGRVYAGFVYIPLDGPVIFFIRRPVEMKGDGVVYIRKPEEIAETIGLNVPEAIGLELDLLPYSTTMRLKGIFPQSELKNASTVMRHARARKTEFEIEMIRRSGVKHVHVYSRIPHLFQPGMTDLGLQVEIERVSRLEGCLGQFRISGDSMELYMGNVLVGDNADSPSPYDFAMGGAGLDPSLPVGANGTPIKPGDTIMVDMNGNYDGYMTDMTRVYALGEISPLALKAHKCSIEIHHALCGMMKPGVAAKDLYAKSEEIVKTYDLHAYYMGHRQHAGFIGHGVGIEINELPVIAPRSRDIIADGNVIAIEPKFVIPGTGAVGIENTYAVYSDHVECLTPAPEEISYFDV
ncbi:MAG: Xaa-Pro peptidase family protein [Bacteroides sp.]|nr:Xaa-Pro peptidase family protein [Bacteroides sp.]